MLHSLRSRLILASVLWTVGLMGVIHGASIILMRGSYPNAHIVMMSSTLPLVAGLVAAAWSWTPFSYLRSSLARVRTGEWTRLAGRYPSEVQSLVNELNALLEDRERAVQRALAVAGDLAHGLKTPLALLAQEAEVAEAAGKPELAESIAHQVERMSRQVNYHLARARAAASGAAGAEPCEVASCIDALVRTLKKLYAARDLRIAHEIPDHVRVRLQRQDLEEILGNLLDNACKWARSSIEIAVRSEGAMVAVMVDDDGSGLPPEMRAAVLERGVRADEATPGFGLGLAIARDLAEIYGGSVELDDSPLGGLRARVLLPSA